MCNSFKILRNFNGYMLKLTVKKWSIKLGDNIQLSWLLYAESSHVFPSEIDCSLQE